jgi:hypothetical protein
MKKSETSMVTVSIILSLVILGMGISYAIKTQNRVDTVSNSCIASGKVCMPKEYFQVQSIGDNSKKIVCKLTNLDDEVEPPENNGYCISSKNLKQKSDTISIKGTNNKYIGKIIHPNEKKEYKLEYLYDSDNKKTSLKLDSKACTHIKTEQKRTVFKCFLFLEHLYDTEIQILTSLKDETVKDFTLYDLFYDKKLVMINEK